MKRTKEIDVWIRDRHSLEDTKEAPICFFEREFDIHDIDKEEAIKAKLIIELPERKKEFTESEIKRFIEKEILTATIVDGSHYDKCLEDLFKD